MDERFRQQQQGLATSSSVNQDDEANQGNQGNQGAQPTQSNHTSQSAQSNQFRPGGAQQQFNSPQTPLNTLPPLTGGTSQFQYGHGTSHPTLGSLPPSTSASTIASNSMIPSIGGHAPLRPIQPSPSYAMNSFASSQPSMHPSSAALTHPHGLAHVPLPGALQGGMGVPGHAQLYHTGFAQPQDTEPVHVVGQQGRRGVLPTHPGRPPPAQGKAPTIPTKNADNKFECPHCIKTYLHLKHLKRHLLRREY